MSPGDELDRLEVAEPLDLGLQHRAHRRDHDLQRAVGRRRVARVAQPAEHGQPAPDRVAARAEPLVRQRLPAGVVADGRRVEEVAERLDEVLGLARGRGHGEHGAARADQPGDDVGPHRLGTGEVERPDRAVPGVGHRRREGGVREDGVGEAGEVHRGSEAGAGNTSAPGQRMTGGCRRFYDRTSTVSAAHDCAATRGTKGLFDVPGLDHRCSTAATALIVSDSLRRTEGGRPDFRHRPAPGDQVFGGGY